MTPELDPLQHLGALLAVRPRHANELERAGQAEAAAIAVLDVAHGELAAAAAKYTGADDQEDLRQRVRALARNVADLRGPSEDARTETKRAFDALADHDHKIKRAAEDVHDPKLVRASSSAAALACMPPDVAARAARGDATADDLRAFLAGVRAHREACSKLREAGANRKDVAWAVFLVPLLEAFTAAGRTPVHSMIPADGLPLEGRIHGHPRALVEWCKTQSEEATSPVHVRNLATRLAEVRRFAELGGRNMNEIDAAAEAQRRKDSPWQQPIAVEPRDPRKAPPDSGYKPPQRDQYEGTPLETGRGLARTVFDRLRGERQ